MIKIVHGLFLAAAALPLLNAQSIQGDDDGGTPRVFGPNFQVELPRWQASHGDNWRTHVDRTTGHLEMLFGGSAQPILQPRTDADWISLARHFVLETEAMHGIANSDLTVDQVVFLPLGMANGTDKMSVGLNQEIGGIRVENGGISVLFNTQGQLLSIHSTAAPRMSGASTSTSVSAGLAAQTAATIFAETVNFTPDTVGEPELVFAQIEESGVRTAHLAWQLDVSFTQDDTVPFSYRYTIDAQSGQMLRRDENIHHFDVGGTINTMATPGSTADHAGNPPQSLAASHVRITSSAGTIFADRDGNFNYPGVNGPLNITATYRSPYTNVNNQGGGNYSITFNGVTGTGNNLLMNPSPSQLLTAQANGMRHVGISRDFIRDTTASDSTGDFLATANVNLNSNCNAFFNGSSINFYTSGGGCNNTCFSSVVAHEWGHWMNVRYGTGNGSDGMGEGNADLFSMYNYDDPVVGRFFTTGGGFVRTGTNNRQFCGDSNPGCHGGVHANGEVWMGAAWKVRVNLNTSLGNALGDATSNQLFLGWMNAFNQTQIRSIIETQWLTLDDDDGNINNGTPNYTAIDNGFRQQGFPGIDLEFVTITNVTQVQNTQDVSGPYVVEADMDAIAAPPVTSAQVFYSVDNGAFQSLAMSLVSGNTYQGLIPGQPAPSRVDYYVRGTDSAANSATFPSDAPGSSLVFYVGQVTDFLTNDFEGPGNDGWTVGDAGDSATTGVWTRQNPNGTNAQPEDDHTAAPGVNCWFTGQGAPGGALGSQDIDGGNTTLKSPIFNMSGLNNPPISYWRWFSNNQGGNPNQDIMTISISNNGGSTWTTVETVGPGGNQSNGGWFQHEFSPHLLLPLTASMQMRFVAGDTGGGSIVEAAIDDIVGIEVGSGCPPPIVYCDGDPNSVGPGAQMIFLGSQSIAADNAQLFVFGAPTFEFGLFLYGLNQASLPVGDGTLCVGNVFYRIFPTVQTDLLGQAFLQIPISNPPAPAAQITSGSVWNFQFWYRDGGGAIGNNLSDAIQIEFCD